MADMSHILLVEDNQDDYEAAVRSLKKNHFMNPVQWCKDGQDALDYLYKTGPYTHNPDVKRPDLILLDLNMPGVDGRRVLQRVKDDPDKRSIPIVILTTSRDSKDVEQCYDMGASTYIQKPLDFDGLTEAIRTMKDYWFGLAILPPHPKQE
ncbi:response regulator [Vibrio sp. S4M6]|uniref:response regulator n=1 Tax=Vibrio sinus TaxID=2946865 RepID=UPI00202A7083|nr:response regulator [Vibrio sinus]MCL9783331.1 response regulator [Vibrio sinus]